MFEKIKKHHRFAPESKEKKHSRKLIKKAREEQRRMYRAAKMNFTAFDSHIEHEYDMAE